MAPKREGSMVDFFHGPEPSLADALNVVLSWEILEPKNHALQEIETFLCKSSGAYTKTSPGISNGLCAYFEYISALHQFVTSLSHCLKFNFIL